MGEGMLRFIIMAVLSTLVFAPFQSMQRRRNSVCMSIDIALKNQPAIRAAQENVNDGRAARRRRYPLLTSG
jgi:hypothetical protein